MNFVDKEALSQHWIPNKSVWHNGSCFLLMVFFLKLYLSIPANYRVVDFIAMFLDLHVLTFVLSIYSVTRLPFLLSPFYYLLILNGTPTNFQAFTLLGVRVS